MCCSFNLLVCETDPERRRRVAALIRGDARIKGVGLGGNQSRGNVDADVLDATSATPEASDSIILQTEPEWR